MKTNLMTPELYDYVVSRCDVPSAVLPDLMHETRKMTNGGMQISPDQGALMNLLVKLTGAKRVLEIGCFTGYSTICMAAGMSPDGLVVTLDISDEYTAIARRYFEKAGLDRRIKIILGPATNSLTKISSDFGPGSFDLAFIDADKENLQSYFESAVHLVRKGGLILVDNALWSGKVVDKSDQSEATKAIRTFNEKIMADRRVERTFLHISDGIYILRRIH